MLDVIRKSEYFSLLDEGYSRPRDMSLKGIQDGWMLKNLKPLSNSKIMEIGGGDSRVLPQLTNNRLWNVEKFEGVGNGPVGVPSSPYATIVPAFIGEFSPLLPVVDVIFSVSVIEHIPFNMYEAAFHDMARCLVPGGRLYHAVDLPLGNQPLEIARRRIAGLIEAVGSAGLVWQDLPAIGQDLVFDTDMATNSDLTAWSWGKISEAARRSGAQMQIVSIKMIAKKLR